MADEEKSVFLNPRNAGFSCPMEVRGNICYFPSYICILSNNKNKITFNIYVENKIIPNSFNVECDPDDTSVSLQFEGTSVEGISTKYYSFMVKLPVLSIEEINVAVHEPAKVNLQIKFKIFQEDLTWYLCGLTDSHLRKVDVFEYQCKLCDTSLEEEASSSDDMEGGWLTTNL